MTTPNTKTLAAQLADGKTARCQGTSPTGRQCILAIHKDDVTHKYIDRDKKRPALSSLMDLSKLTATDVAPGQALSKQVQKTAAPRGTDQRKVDSDAAKNLAKNIAAKTHAGMAFEALKHSQYIVPKPAVDAVLELLKATTTTGGPGKGKVFRYRQGTHASGNQVIHWALTDKAPAKPASPVSDANQ